jgi:hypothetical protein
VPNIESVYQVLLDESGTLKKATGVEFLYDGALCRVEGVQRDVVISAGVCYLR